MKYINMCLTFGIGIGVGMILMVFYIRFDMRPIKRSQVMIDKSFVIDGKEWQCGYTARQVEINQLEEQIAKIKNQ